MCLVRKMLEPMVTAAGAYTGWLGLPGKWAGQGCTFQCHCRGSTLLFAIVTLCLCFTFGRIRLSSQFPRLAVLNYSKLFLCYVLDCTLIGL